MKIVTWNVNSLAVRMPRVLEFLEKHRPEVLTLQETRSPAEAFPSDELAEVGYRSVHHSAGQWAGVAIVARDDLAIEEETPGLAGEPAVDEARWIEAVVDGVRVVSAYVPNGRAVGTETFDQKLAFYEAMIDRAVALRDTPLAITGDMNVMREDRDIYDPAAFKGSTHVTSDERSRFERLMSEGDLVDAYRHVHPDEVGYTWWDYRAGNFHKGLGIRIDYILVSPDLAGRLTRRRHRPPVPQGHEALRPRAADRLAGRRPRRPRQAGLEP